MKYYNILQSEMNKNKLPSIFLLSILFKFIRSLHQESNIIEFHIEIGTNEVKKQIDFDEKKTIDFMENMRIIINELPNSEITNEDCRKLENRDIIAKNDEIKKMDEFLQEKIIPKKFKNQKKEAKSLSELVLFYQMAKIALNIVNILKINGDYARLSENIFCQFFENHTCNLAKNADEFAKKLKDFIETIKTFFKKPPKGYLERLINVINLWAMFGNDEKELLQILSILDDLELSIKSRRKQISVKIISDEKGKQDKFHLSERKENSAPISVKKNEEKDDKIFVKKEHKRYEIYMPAYKARELIANMDELIKNLLKNKILPFDKDKMPIPNIICRELATSTYFDGMISKNSEIIAKYRAEVAKNLLRSREDQYNKHNNKIHIEIPKKEAIKLINLIVEIGKKDLKNDDNLCQNYNEIFHGFDSDEKWKNEIFNDLKRQAKEIFKIEEKINCLDEMLELRTCTTIAQKILVNKEGYPYHEWKKKFAQIAEMIGEWMAKKDVQKNSLESWEEFEQKWILNKFSISILEDDAKMSFKSKDKHYINCVHNLVTLRLLDEIVIGLVKRAMSTWEEDGKQIVKKVFPKNYTEADYWKFHKNLTRELPKVITSSIGGISNQNGKLDVDLWVDMEEKMISKYEFSITLNFDRSLDPREIKKKMEVKRLEEEMNKEAERLEAERIKRKNEASEKAQSEKEEAEVKRKETEKATTFNITLKWDDKNIKEFMRIIKGMIRKFRKLDENNFCEMLWNTAQNEFWGLITFNDAFRRILHRIREELASKLYRNEKGKVVKYKEIYGKSKLNMPTNCIYDVVMTYTATEIASYILDNNFFLNLVFHRISESSLKKFKDRLNFIRKKTVAKISRSGIISVKNWKSFLDKWFHKKIQIKYIENEDSNEEESHYYYEEITHHQMHHYGSAVRGNPCTNGNWSTDCEFLLNHPISHSFKLNRKPTKEPKGINKNAEPPKEKKMQKQSSSKRTQKSILNDDGPKNGKPKARSFLNSKKFDAQQNKKEGIPSKSFLKTHPIPKNFFPESSQTAVNFKFVYDNVPGDGNCLFNSIVRALNAGNKMSETKIFEQSATLRKLVEKKLAKDADEKMTSTEKEALYTNIMSEDLWQSKLSKNSPKLKDAKDWIIKYSTFMTEPSKGDERKWGGEIEITFAEKLFGRRIVVIQLTEDGQSPETLEELEKSVAKYDAIWIPDSKKNMKNLGLVKIQSLNDFFNRLKENEEETTIVLTRSTNHYRPIYKDPPSETVKQKNNENLKLLKS